MMLTSVRYIISTDSFALRALNIVVSRAILIRQWPSSILVTGQ